LFASSLRMPDKAVFFLASLVVVSGQWPDHICESFVADEFLNQQCQSLVV